MSDPVTNVEIEDVLTSIRRLVSDGDKARTRDPAPVEVASNVPDAATLDISNAPESREPESTPDDAKTDRLVLTPAFLVVDADDAPKAGAEPETEDHTDNEDDGWEVEDDTSQEPLALTEMVWEDVDDAEDISAEADAEPVKLAATEKTDRSSLVATIAELEAAISASSEDYEPDGSEEMGETIAWPGAALRSSVDVEEAEVSDDAEDEDDTPATFEHRKPQTSDHAPETSEKAELQVAPDDADVYGDDDLDGILEAGGATLDEDALRALIADVVREELTGPLGERITRNVRKLVRREIYRILSSQEFD